MIDFEVAKRSGLRQKGELDVLFGVSYPMTNAYLSGKSYPRGANRAHIDLTLQVLARLIEKGSLPLAEGKDMEGRAKAVEKIRGCIDKAKTENV